MKMPRIVCIFFLMVRQFYLKLSYSATKNRPIGRFFVTIRFYYPKIKWRITRWLGYFDSVTASVPSDGRPLTK